MENRKDNAFLPKNEQTGLEVCTLGDQSKTKGSLGMWDISFEVILICSVKMYWSQQKMFENFRAFSAHFGQKKLDRKKFLKKWNHAIIIIITLKKKCNN